MSQSKFAARCLLSAVFLLSGQAVMADTLKDKTVHVIVPYPAGGAGDVLTRVLAQAITDKTGQTIVVENKPGAGSIVGTELAERATPDGTTVLLVENPYVLSAVLHPNVHYHPVKSFDPICYLADTPAVLAVSEKSDIHSLEDFIKAAKAGPMSYGSTGPASIAHIAGELLKRDAKIDLTYVPFPGSPPAVNAVLGGHINAVIANYSDLKSQLSAGTLRPLFVPATRRIEPLPDVPTLIELGYKNIEATVWFGFVAPRGTPKEILAELTAEFSAAIRVPGVKSKLAAQGIFTSVSCGEPFGQFLATQTEKYIEFAREFNIKPE